MSLSLFFSGRWRASGEPLLTDFIDERAQWMTKVLNDNDISRKAMMFDQAQNVKRYLCGFNSIHVWLWIGLCIVESE